MQKLNNSRLNKPAAKQKGIALIIFALILVFATITFLVSQLDGNGIKIERDKKTAAALAKAKQALIGWSISRGAATGTPRPGELPCPDTDAPGALGYGDEEGVCTAGKVGRFPWRTLRVEELTDGYGEPLWYSIDGNFRKFAITSKPLNSDTKASMQIYEANGITLATNTGNEAAAVIFAAGPLLSGQKRSATNVVICAATTTNIAENRCATNYLDVLNGRNNSITNGPFIRARKSDTFNDQLIYISASELMHSVEKRVAGQLKTILQNYITSNGSYPYPAKFDAAGCLDTDNNAYTTDCKSDASVCRGRFPDVALPIVWGVPLPSWFTFNLWGQTIYYAVGTNSLSTSPLGCSAQLTVDSTASNGVLIMAGTPIGSIVRNNPLPLGESSNLSDYLEDAENQDSWGALANDIYVTPPVVAKDSLYVLP
jgi:hypothetical protein